MESGSGVLEEGADSAAVDAACRVKVRPPSVPWNEKACDPSGEALAYALSR
jgi:hypothetical protein